ncbi:MAG: hypothetical protein HC906_11575 [Bacteroidales bacterium]|nr:hypothetical protein [Bacteroidales bacterium]
MKKSFFILTLSFFIVFPFFNSTGQEVVHEIYEDSVSISDSSVEDGQNSQMNVVNNESEGNLSIWFYVLFLTLGGGFLFYFLRTKRKNLTYNNELERLSSQIISLQNQIVEKEKEFTYKTEEKNENTLENEFLFQSEGMSKLNEIISKNKNNATLFTQVIETT